MNNYDNNNLILFTAIILCMFIIFLEMASNCPSIIILFQIIIFSIFLHLLFVPPVGLYDSDPLVDFHLVELISKYGWSLNLDSSLAPWPFIHIYICSSSSVMGISLLDASRYLPSIISALSLFFVFCLANFFFKNSIASNAAILLFSSSYMYIMFYSMLVRENAAFLILFLAFYCFLTGTEKNDIRLIFLSIFSGLTLIITHHFTTLIFIIVLIIYFIYWDLVSFFVDFSLAIRYRITYGLLILIASLFYWFYVSTNIIQSLAVEIKSFLIFGEEIVRPFANMTIYSPLENSLLLKLYFYSLKLTFITSIILIISVYKKGIYNKIQLYNYLLLSITSFCSIIWLLATYGIIKITIYPDRFLNFTWVFLLIFLGKRLYDLFMINHFTWGKALSICFIVSFITMNISQLAINSYLFDPAVEPPYANGRMSLMHLPQEYDAFNWFNGLNVTGRIQGDRTTEDFISLHNRNVKTDVDLFRGNLSRLADSNWLIIRKEMHKIIIGTREDNNAIKKPVNLSNDLYKTLTRNYILKKIYDNDEVEIYNIN